MSLGGWALIAVLALAALSGPVLLLAMGLKMYIDDTEWWTVRKKQWEACTGPIQCAAFVLRFIVSAILLLCWLLLAFLFGNNSTYRPRRAVKRKRV